MFIPIHAKNIETNMSPTGGWKTKKIESMDVVTSKNGKRYEVILNLSGKIEPSCAEILEYSTKKNKKDHDAIISYLKKSGVFQNRGQRA